MRKNVATAVKFFERGPFDHLLRAFQVRYERTGEAAGTIYTLPLSHDEITALAEFMETNVYALELQRKLSLKDFDRQLQAKYPGVGLEQLLSTYFEVVEVGVGE